MSPSNLFSTSLHSDEPQPPEFPTFWVRRIVLLDRLSADARIIREIPFRRGMNVVRVADGDGGYTGPIGHSVGKTLLTRLIRYSLGERYYATDEVAARIVGVYPDGYVLAHAVVGSDDWIVARPLLVAGNSHSFSIQSDDWHALVSSSGARCSYDYFVAALSNAAIGHRPLLQLPDAKRSARWQDVLGWLARDQECNFTHYNVWRSKDAHSDSREHSRSDCSLIAAWAMGLINQSENDLRMAHQELLEIRETAERQMREGAAAQATSRRLLKERFPALSQEENDDLFSKTASSEASEKVRQLKRLQADMDAPVSLIQTRASVSDLRKLQLDANGKLERLKAQIQAKESQIDTEQAATPTAAYSPLCLCPDKPPACPRNSLNNKAAETIRQAETVQRIERELVPLQILRGHAKAELETIAKQLHTAEAEYEAESTKHRESLCKLAESIGRWEAHAEEVKSYSDAKARGERAEQQLGKLESQITKSSEALRRARETQTLRISQLSRVYKEILKELLGQDMPGQIELDGWGVRPKPSVELKTNGQAMASLATVIGFDLACLRAAALGLIDLPRFLVHDSPKASDLESSLYDRVYLPLFQLDPADANKKPSFQYIITTTTVPPQAAAREPYVCLILDARTLEGHLLKAKF